ncbi:MAG: YggS family pyridoxal phosphate-dependent enzyme [Bacteroidales bacterium]|nr:YggS family pyridoxal phosphate-dependent enzyme [Bacteroidales bacterium]MDD4685228.1 YggS family pyridoxal phosphate-dependent enzyme [Bacteroidales bacterium]
MGIADNLKTIGKKIPQNVKLIAVSKTKPVEIIQEAYDFGHRIFGENKPQELRDKQAIMPKDIEWHFIGHLQTNKVKYIAPFVSLIHGVDSLKVLNEINKQAIRNDRVIDCLIQIDIAHEETKFGLLEDQARELLNSDEFRSMKNVRICGLMGIGSITNDLNKTRGEFKELKTTFLKLKEEFFLKEDSFSEVSMGMSSDYSLAIEEGSTMVRIGSSIFGERDYLK